MTRHQFTRKKRQTLLHVAGLFSVLCSFTLHESDGGQRTALIRIYRAVLLWMSAAGDQSPGSEVSLRVSGCSSVGVCAQRFGRIYWKC